LFVSFTNSYGWWPKEVVIVSKTILGFVFLFLNIGSLSANKFRFVIKMEPKNNRHGTFLTILSGGSPKK